MSTVSREDEAAPIVYVVDDDARMCTSLDTLFRSVGWQVQTFASTAEFRGNHVEQRGGCLLLDVRLRGESGLMYQQRDHGGPSFPVIFMTGFADVKMCRQAMKAGAVDFLLKPFADQEVIDAVNAALLIDEKQRAADRTRRELHSIFARLSARERQVFSYVVAGAQNKQIASYLGVSVITVKLHRAAMMRKMNASSLADLVRKAMSLDLPALPAIKAPNR